MALLDDQGEHSGDHHRCDDHCDAAERAGDRDERERGVAGDELGATHVVTGQHCDVVVEHRPKIVGDRIDVGFRLQRDDDKIHCAWMPLRCRRRRVREEQCRLVFE